MTFEEAAERLVENNHELKIKGNEILAANASLRQSKMWENPEVAVIHNINNPVSNKYFDFGREGETDVQVSQRIPLFGQRRNTVLRDSALLNVANGNRDVAKRQLVATLFQAMASLDGLLQKSELFDSQAELLTKILNAYTAQQSQGNVPAAETLRIKAMLFAAQKEIAENNTQISEYQTVIKSLIGFDENIKPIMPMLEKDSVILLIDSRIDVDSLPEIRALKAEQNAADHEANLQKSLAFPEVNILAEWDKNGNIGRNFFAAGVGLTVPIFNRNQGNIAAAKIRADEAQDVYNHQVKINKLSTENLENQARLLMDFYFSDNIADEQQNIMQNVANQYIKRNISITEFVSYNDAYCETLLALIESKTNFLIIISELKTAKGL